MRCSLSICPHLVSLFLVGEKPVSFYAAFISVCISDISLVVKKKKRKKKPFLVVLKKREEKKRRSYLLELLTHSLIGFFSGNQHASWNASIWVFCKRGVHKCILHCHDDSLGMLFFFQTKLFKYARAISPVLAVA